MVVPAYIARSCFSLFSSAFLAHNGLFQHETSSLISKPQPGRLTTTSGSLSYHLLRMYQLDTRTVRVAISRFETTKLFRDDALERG